MERVGHSGEGLDPWVSESVASSGSLGSREGPVHTVSRPEHPCPCLLALIFERGQACGPKEQRAGEGVSCAVLGGRPARGGEMSVRRSWKASLGSRGPWASRVGTHRLSWGSLGGLREAAQSQVPVKGPSGCPKGPQTVSRAIVGGDQVPDVCGRWGRGFTHVLGGGWESRI